MSLSVEFRVHKLAHWFCMFALAFTLAACGGGGGSEPPASGGEEAGQAPVDDQQPQPQPPVIEDEPEEPPAPPAVTEFPFRAALEKFATVPQVLSLNGTGSDGPYALSLWTAPGPDRVYPDSTFKTFIINEHVTRPDGGTVVRVTEILYRDPFVIGLIEFNGDWIAPSTTFTAPLTAIVGTRSTLFKDATVYNGDWLHQPPKGTAELAWRFDRRSATTAWMCLSLNQTLAGTNDSTEYCLAIDENGDASAMRLAIGSDDPGGLNVEFQ